MKKLIWLMSLLLGVSLALTACGGSGASAASTTMTVDMKEFQFTPDQFTVPAGQQITLNLTNSGSVEHDFTILKKGVSPQSPFDAQKYASEIYYIAKLDAGQSTTQTFTAPTDPGTYEIICSQPSHLEAGMKATLTVVGK